MKLKKLFVLTALTASLPLTSQAAPGGGVLIQILVESGRAVMDTSAAEALGACLADDGTASLVLGEEGLECAEPALAGSLACASPTGLCIIDNLGARAVSACDASTGRQLVEVEISNVRSAGPLDLAWHAESALRCEGPTGLCGNFDGDDADRHVFAEAVEQCMDLDGDGAAELYTEGRTVRCSSYAPADGQPLVEVARATVSAPCTPGGNIAIVVLDSLKGEQTTTAYGTADGQWGLEIRRGR